MEFNHWIAAQSDSRPVEAVILDNPVPVTELPTPALLLDETVLDANLAIMGKWSEATGIALRPHSKMHKCPIIAKKQLALGAQGICCAKISEAAIMQRAGIAPILVTSPLIEPTAIAKAATLAKTNQALTVVVDSRASALGLEQALDHVSANLLVLIDIDPGLGRTGIAPGDELLKLAAFIQDECSHLNLQGLQIYAGHCMHIVSAEVRYEKYQRALQAGQDAKQLLEAEGYVLPLLSGGGTGSYEFEPDVGLLNELQAGSYAFMDIEYRDIETRARPVFDDFDIALTVLVTPISQPKPRTITVDAGFKSLASDKMVPEFKDVEGLTYYWGGDEHGIVALNNPSRDISLGDKLKLITPHCDPTVNLFDYYYVVREEHVHELWPISTRGCSQ